MFLPLNIIAACTDPPPRPPLFRGAGGMSLVFLHTPSPFQKGRAGAVGLVP